MRQRRIERLLLRAEVAHEAGCEEDAREALAEAERLDPHAPGIAELNARLSESLVATAVPDLELSLQVPEDAAQDEDVETIGRHRGVGWVPSAAAAVIVLGAAGWLAVPRRSAVPMSSVVSTAQPPVVVSPDAAAPQPETTPVEPPVHVAVEEVPVTAESTAAAGAALERAPEPLALVGREIPAPRSTGEAPVSGVDRAVPRPARVETPAPAAPPPVPVASAPQLERTPSEPLAVAPPLPPLARAALPASELSSETTAVPARPVVPDDAAVRSTLARYESAYSRLDADAAGVVWPALDRRALARAFDGLTSQRVQLGSCDVRVAGETAVAECSGSATWTPKVGGGSRSQQRRWQFRLRNSEGEWQIVGATVR